VELYNSTTHPIDLRGWEVDVTNAATSSTATFAFLSGTDVAPMIISAGQRAVIARSTNALGYGVDIADFYWGAAALSDAGGTVVIVFEGSDVDVVEYGGSGCTSGCAAGSTTSAYDDEWYWRTGHAMSLAESVFGPNMHNANDFGDNWCEERDPIGGSAEHGSPGEEASVLGPCG
jgi:hypothetical protein